jgi:hypothetical protein
LIEVGQPLEVGQRIRVFGGYDMYPEWLEQSPEGVLGTVVEFIPGENEEPAVIVQLDSPLETRRGTGTHLVLEQGWVGVKWGQTSPRVHVELCDFRPAGEPSSRRRRGSWAESHATFETLPRRSA